MREENELTRGWTVFDRLMQYVAENECKESVDGGSLFDFLACLQSRRCPVLGRRRLR